MTLRSKIALAALLSATQRSEELLYDFKNFYDAFSASLRHGKAYQVLEHDEVVSVALSLGKAYTLHTIAMKSGSAVNIAPIILQLHAEYARIHGDPFNG